MVREEIKEPSPAESADLLLGQTLAGRYHLERLIAKGGMGRVYLAIQHPLGRRVAIKVLTQRGDIASDPNFVRRFFLEAAVCARLAHPNIITVHDYGEGEDGRLFMAMEYLDGEPLSTVIKRDGAMNEPRAAMIALHIARALREAHAHGIIHRDLKPGNIMLLRGRDEEAGDAVKVLDFGLVKVFQVEGEGAPLPSELADLDLTRGMLIGSPRYMSPEQVRNEALDPRTDLYSLGVILYQMLAGRTPFNGRTSVDIMHAHLHDPPPLLPHVSPEMSSLVMSLLEKSRDARPASAQELIKALKTISVPELLRAHTGPSLVPRLATPVAIAAPEAALAEPVPDEASNTQQLREPEVEAPPPRPQRAFPWWAVAALLAGILAVMVWWPADPKTRNMHPSLPLREPSPPAKVIESSAPVEIEAKPAPASDEELPAEKKRPLRPRIEPKPEGVPDIRLQR